MELELKAPLNCESKDYYFTRKDSPSKDRIRLVCVDGENHLKRANEGGRVEKKKQILSWVRGKITH